MSRDLTSLLRQAMAVRAPLRASAGTDCFRVLDGEGTPLYIDVYGDGVVIHGYADVGPKESSSTLHSISELSATARVVGQAIGARAAWIKLRPRQANTLVAPGLLTPPDPAWGQPTAALGERWTHEHGLQYLVRLGDGLATGLYLDQRDNRQWLRGQARDKRVLNTFGYTGAFSVAAAAGGAARTVTIDAAAPALATARANLDRNGFDDPQRHDLIRGDVLPWLAKLARRGDRFDLVVLDPPSYSTVKGHRWTAARDYPALVQAACAVTARHGTLLACINAATVDARRLRQMAAQGVSAAGRRCRRIALQPTQIDHPEGRMKSIVVDLDD